MGAFLHPSTAPLKVPSIHPIGVAPRLLTPDSGNTPNGTGIRRSGGFSDLPIFPRISKAEAGNDAGVQTRPLPYFADIQRSFGRFSLAGAEAVIGGSAETANDRWGSSAFTRNDRILFKQAPDLHTAAHEAAHIIQQRSGLGLPGGIGRSGDCHEQNADAVADAVAAGTSAERLLQPYGGRQGTPSTQIQFQGGSDAATAAAAQVCADLRAALENSRRVIALYHDFLAGNIDMASVRSQINMVGNAAEGVTAAGRELPQVVQDAIAEVESFGFEELLHMGRLVIGLTGDEDFFYRQWTTNEIERQEHLNLVIIESMYTHGCPDFPGTWSDFQDQVLSVGTRGSEQRSSIESPRETRTAVAWVTIGEEEILVLATEVAGSGRLRFVRWIDHDFRDLALEQARVMQGAVPTVPASAVSGLPTEVSISAAHR